MSNEIIRRWSANRSRVMRADLAVGRPNYGPPIRRRNEPEEFFNPVKRPKDPHDRKPKRPQPSIPQFKCLNN